MMTYEEKTNLHIERVAGLLNYAAYEMYERAANHDKSKFEAPERQIFAQADLRFGYPEYGSPEHGKFMEFIEPATKSHYEKNRHHPEHFSNGIDGMNLFDVVEMVMDWIAASERTGSAHNVIKFLPRAKERFGISDQLYSVIENTIRQMIDRDFKGINRVSRIFESSDYILDAEKLDGETKIHIYGISGSGHLIAKKEDWFEFEEIMIRNHKKPQELTT